MLALDTSIHIPYTVSCKRAGREARVHHRRGSSPPFLLEVDSRNSDAISLTISLSKQLSAFLRENLSFFQSYDRVIIYYDNGQMELNRILASIFATTLSAVEFRKVIPSEYRLFQVADMCCSLELIKLKLDRNELTASESIFFGSIRDLQKNYLKPMEKLYWQGEW